VTLKSSREERIKISHHLRDLRELHDVGEELRIIAKVLGKQKTHVEKMEKAYRNELKLEGTQGMKCLAEALDIINRKLEQIKRMEENVGRARRGVRPPCFLLLSSILDGVTLLSLITLV